MGTASGYPRLQITSPSVERAELASVVAPCCAPNLDFGLGDLPAREVARVAALECPGFVGVDCYPAGFAAGEVPRMPPGVRVHIVFPPLRYVRIVWREEKLARMRASVSAFDLISRAVLARPIAARNDGGAGERGGDNDDYAERETHFGLCGVWMDGIVGDSMSR